MICYYVFNTVPLKHVHFREPNFQLDCTSINVSSSLNPTFPWSAHSCLDMKDVLPICQFPYYDLNVALPESKGFNYFMSFFIKIRF